MKKLEGKTVVVTGIGRGLGAALGELAGNEGAFVAGFDLIQDNIDKLSKRFNELKIPHYLEVLDITQEDKVEAFFNHVVSKTGKIDVLINNAGITNIKLFEENSNREIQKVMDVNFMGSVYCTRFALPHIISSKGSISVISSVAGFAPLTGRTAYAASKHAVQGFFETLRVEVRNKGVHVMVVCPSYIDTDIRAHTYKVGEDNTNTKAKIGENDSPQEVAQQIIDGIFNKKEILITGKVGKIAYLLKRLSPKLYEKMMFKNTRKAFDL
jgi:NAD(P)-dependent dehydrogenase (short-subunit alcohol dehydrogenase family)